MFRILLSTIIIVMMAMPVMADKLVFDTPQVVSPVNATGLDWDIVKYDKRDRHLRVLWRLVDENGIRIPISGVDSKGWLRWDCRDIRTRGENALCVGEEDPWECCTGVGTGDCDGWDNTCFASIYNFKIQEQHVGSDLGQVFLLRIWTVFKNDPKVAAILQSIDGTFE